MSITKAAIEFQYTLKHKMAEDAVASGNVEALNKLLTDKSQNEKKLIESITFEENCLLAIAAQHGHVAMVNRLLQIPVVLKDAAAKNNAALWAAIKNGHLDIVNRLLKIPSVLQKMIANSQFALNLAVLSEDLAILNCILEFPGILERLDTCGNSILEMALENEHQEMVKRLLEIPTIQMQDAATKGDLVTFCQLLEHHGVMESYTLDHILLIVLNNGHLNIIDYLLKLPDYSKVISANMIMLERAAICGHLNIVNRLLEIPSFREKLEANSAEFLRSVVWSGNLELLNRVLEIPAVLKNSIEVFKEAMNPPKHFHIINRLLEIKEVADYAANSSDLINNVAYSESADLLLVERLLQIPGVKERCNLKTVYNANYFGSFEKVNRLLEIPHVLDMIKKEGASEILRKRQHPDIMTRLFQIQEVYEKAINDKTLHSVLALAVDSKSLALVNRLRSLITPKATDHCRYG